jgi:hypothetical protein
MDVRAMNMRRANRVLDLSTATWRYQRRGRMPSTETMPWGTRDMSLKDPFGNRLTITTTISD